MPCKVFYGYKDLNELFNKYKILSDEGLDYIKRKLAWELNFRLERTYGDVIRKLYFTIFEIASIYRELSFKNANPSYTLPSVIHSLNTTLELTVSDGQIRLKNPLVLDVEVLDLIKRYVGLEVDKISGNSISIDLSRYTGVKGLILDAKMEVDKGILHTTVDLKLPLENKGFNREVTAEELNKVLVVTARETNQKAIGIHQQLTEVSQSLIESIVEPILYDLRDEFINREGVSDIVYVPYARPFILNASFSALNSEEEAQLFSEKCRVTIHKLKKVGDLDLGNGLKLTRDGKVLRDNEEVKEPSTLSYAVFKALISRAKKSVVIIEYPEEYQTEESKKEVLEEIIRLSERGNTVYVVTADKEVLNTLAEKINNSS
ncbi:hypothetical protein [Stygiolobus caldivivus]|uniref:Uncharacterized protein n=1 Tax=Stygiolobus caldivivus TaxID=2824673 RepID=A0A8D5U9E6_9CREN|nr:hypothetical protein [Stygiolobus caldivivus]BCU71480.1 hypothetical protein KN1_27770 [Stygiolobus caldivivus]